MANIVIYENGKFLLTQRKADEEDDPAFDGKWQLPGGGLEIGEDIKTVIQREAKEELGIDIDVKRSLALTEVISHTAHWHRVSMAFLCKRSDPNQPIQVNHESYGYGWFTIEEAGQLDLMPHTLSILEYIAKSYRLFKIGVLAVIKNEEKFLLMKIQAPGKKKAHGKWACMMGTCDINESLTEALVREVKEETGLDVTINKLLPHVIEMYDLKIFSYVVQPKDPNQEVQLNYEATDWGWFSYDEAMHLTLYGNTATILQEAMQV
jgi:8-oxo-dGTP pyrophosphatase MutT (NUDIX family)